MNGIIDSIDMSLRKLWEIVKDREAWHAAVHEVIKSWTRMSNLTTPSYCLLQPYIFVNYYSSNLGNKKVEKIN